MRIPTVALASALVAAFGFSGAAQAQRPDAQQVNPSPMPPGSVAGAAPGMGSTGAAAALGAPIAGAQPSPMPPGSEAGEAPGMGSTGAAAEDARERAARPGISGGGSTVVTGMGRIGGTGIHAPDAQPDVVPGTLRPGAAVPPPAAPTPGR